MIGTSPGTSAARHDRAPLLPLQDTMTCLPLRKRDQYQYAHRFYHDELIAKLIDFSSTLPSKMMERSSLITLQSFVEHTIRSLRRASSWPNTLAEHQTCRKTKLTNDNHAARHTNCDNTTQHTDPYTHSQRNRTNHHVTAMQSGSPFVI